jgi:hypothetical protein
MGCPPDPALPKRPEYAVGTIDLTVSPKQRSLQVSVTPSAAALLGDGQMSTPSPRELLVAGAPWLPH